jgi:hypothetical protein
VLHVRGAQELMDDPVFGPQPAPVAAPPATIQRRLLGWDDRGNPVLTTVPVVTPKAMQDLYAAAATLPYEGPEKKYEGMSLAEVIVRRQIEAAAHGLGDDEKVLDRLMGKAKQRSESLTVVTTYEGMLKAIAEGVSTPPPGVVDAEVVK